MVVHSECRRFICALDAIKLLDENMHCAYCRGSLKQDVSDVTSQSTFQRPSPNDQFSMDKIQFQCQHCSETFPRETARNHNSTCEENPIREAHQPPAPLQPRGLAPLVRREVISNNIADDTPERSERLVIYHHNGVQIKTRMHSPLLTVKQLKSFIANITDTQPEELQMVKFIHRVLEDDLLLSDVARTDGSTYLATFSDLQDVRGRALHLTLEDVGTPHITDEQRQEQRRTRDRRMRRDRDRMIRLGIQASQPRQPRAFHQPADFGVNIWGDPEEEEW